MSIFTKLSSFLSSLLPSEEAGSLGVPAPYDLIERSQKESGINATPGEAANRIGEQLVLDTVTSRRPFGGGKLHLLPAGTKGHDAENSKVMLQIKGCGGRARNESEWAVGKAKGGLRKAESNLQLARAKGKSSYYAFVKWDEGRIREVYVVPTENVISILARKGGKDKLSVKQLKDNGHTSIL